MTAPPPPDPGTVPSPCLSVCRIERDSGLCAGCGRTLAEIAAWPTMTDAERRAVLTALQVRGTTTS